MRSPVVSLKCMYRGIHRFCKSKGEEGSVQKCASIVSGRHCFAKVCTNVRAWVKNLTYLSAQPAKLRKPLRNDYVFLCSNLHGFIT